MSVNNFSNSKSPTGIYTLANAATSEVKTMFSASFSTEVHTLQFQRAFAVQFNLTGSGVASPPTGNIQISGSLDNVNFVGLEALTSFTTTGSIIRNFDSVAVGFVKCNAIRTGGSTNVSASFLINAI